MKSSCRNLGSPISENTVTLDTPLWSVMIPTFNCARYLEKTIKSVLEADLGSEVMQVEVVDDHSTKDDPAEVVRTWGRGRVQFFRQPQNVGLAKNFNSCITRSKGKLVHILHGDDFVLPNFYSRLTDIYKKNRSECGFFATRTVLVDSDGNEIGVSRMVEELENPTKCAKEIFYTNEFRTPGIVVSRVAYESLGGFREDLSHVADWEMWVRLISAVGGIMLDEPLACYRIFDKNDTSKLARSGENLREYFKAEKYFRAYNNNFDRQLFTRNVRGHMLGQVVQFMNKGDLDAAQNNLDSWFSEVGILRSLNGMRRLGWKKGSALLPLWIRSVFNSWKSAG